MRKVAVVILNWNGRKFLEQFLPFVVTHTSEDLAEIVVADNGSSDDSVEWLEQNMPQVTCVKLDKNYGFAGGYNRALKEIKAHYFLLLNSDIQVEQGWLEPLVDWMDNNPLCGACAPKVHSFAQKGFFEHAGAAGGFIDKYGFPFCRGRIVDEAEEDLGQYDKNSQVFWATGACMMVRASIFQELDGFDEDFFAHMEEIDLCWRIQNRGLQVWYVHDSVVYHVGGGALSIGHPFKVFLNFRNNLFMLYKNLPREGFRRILFARKVLDGIAAFKFLLGGEWGYFKAVLKAHRDYYKDVDILRQKRQELLSQNKPFSHLSGVYSNGIMYDFFIRKKKRFNELTW